MKTAIPIVSTKLHPPIVRDDIVQRPRLLGTLASIVRRRLTLLCAGAGYGKTTLLSAIIASNYPVVWYSLSPSDRDLGVFTFYLVHGIRQHEPSFGESVMQFLSGRERLRVNPEIIAAELVNALSEVKGTDLAIVLDDFHFIDRNKDILKILDYLLTNLPSHSHLVIATRRSPRIASLPRLRMIGQAIDVTEADLRFTPDEGETLFSQIYDLRLGSEALRIVAEQNEGWIVGLHLIAQSLKVKRLDGVDDLLTTLGANKKRLFEYLAQEVFKSQPANVQRFLYESSVLSTFSAETCNSIFDRTDSSAMLDYAENNNLFVVEVADGHWRYHKLFRDFLRQQVNREPGRLNDLHRRAGDYFESRRDYSQAIEHYIAGADYQHSARLICEVGQDMLCASRFDTLTYWIDQIPDEFLREAPDLLFLRAQVLELQGHYSRSVEWLERAAAAFATKKDGVGLSKVLRSKAYVGALRLDKQEETGALCHEALGYLSPENKRDRADLLRRMAFIDVANADPSEAFGHFEEALLLFEDLGDKEGITATLITPGMIVHNFRGDFSEALHSLRRAYTLALELGSEHWIAACLGCMAVTLRHLNRCEEAKECAQKALALSREIGAVGVEAHSITYLGIACLGGRTPDLDAARYYFEESARLAESEGNGLVRVSALMCKVVAQRRLGEIDEIARSYDQLLATVERIPNQWMIAVMKMNIGAALVNLGAARAEALLHSALEGFKLYHDKWSLTCVNFWIAVLYSRSKPHRALEHLQISLQLAEANGYGFWFVEEAETTEALLALAIRHGVQSDYCARLLDDIRPGAAADVIISTQDEWAGTPNFKALRHKRGRGTSEGLGRIDVLPDRDGVPRQGRTTAAQTAAGEKPLLRIQCFGNFQVQVGDRKICESEWQRRKVKSLLKYLASAQDHSATRDQLMEVLWGDLEPEVARVYLNHALHLLRRLLDPQRRGYPSDYIASEYVVLRLLPDVIQVIDIDEFRNHIAAAESAQRLGNTERAERTYEAAVALYVGDFLNDDPYEEWTMPTRDLFRNLYLTAMEKIAKWRMDAHEYQSAITYLRRVLHQDRAREDVHVLLMQCLARTGKRNEALRQYVTCCKAISDELDIEPARETQLLYGRLVSGEAI